MSKHPTGCICKKCRAKRKAKFPNGCLLCFTQPRLPDERHCASCAAAAANKQAEKQERIQRLRYADDRTLRRESVVMGSSISSRARMLGHT